MLKTKKKKCSPTVQLLNRVIDLDVVYHIIIGGFVRLFLVFYGVWHDNTSAVRYTDVDYRVFTDAARHVLNGDSPYDRHTFRYSPLIAFLLVPNIVIHSSFGKIIFCIADLAVAYLIEKLVYLNVVQFKLGKTKQLKHIKGKNNDVEVGKYWSQRSAMLWLYNPVTLAISTRGSSDSLACFLVILTLYLLQIKHNPFQVGLLHGLSIHFRLYPIIYSFTFFMYLSKFSCYISKPVKAKNAKKNLEKYRNVVKKHSVKTNQPTKSIFRKDFLLYLIPNFNQLMLVCGVITSLSLLTGIFYFLYGYKFLYESLIYHFVRLDFKHNFSLYFYLQYLSAWVTFDSWTMGLWNMVLTNLPPVVLLLYFSIYFGLKEYALNFAILCETIVFVIYNKVLTSQYFVWILSLLPLCIWQIKLSGRTAFFLTFIWFLAQAAWLFPAYLLEFRGENTFIYIWIQGVSLFCAHIGILGRILKSFITTMYEHKRYD